MVVLPFFRVPNEQVIWRFTKLQRVSEMETFPRMYTCGLVSVWGNVTVERTFVAVFGPKFFTVTVYVVGVEIATLAGALMLTLRSALAATATPVVAASSTPLVTRERNKRIEKWKVSMS